jgi:hypothetical protein
MGIILEGTPYKYKKFRNAEGDAATEPVAPVVPPVVVPKSNIKKYLLWGAIIIGAYLLYKKFGKK